MGPVFTLLTPADTRLLQAARRGLVVADEPFAELGQRLGLSGDEVLSRLRGLAGSGLIDGVRLVALDSACASADGAAHAGTKAGAADAREARLLVAVASGLPLVPRPFEAVGAMLGLPACAVQQAVQRWLLHAPGRCIAPTMDGKLVQP